ncbi:hypothetical protein ACFLV7_00880 [Chloroflexota bacterium]
MKENPCHAEESAFIDALTEYRKQKTKSLMQPGQEPIPRDKNVVPQVISDEAIEKHDNEVERAKKKCEEARKKLMECLDNYGIEHHHDQYDDCDDYR